MSVYHASNLTVYPTVYTEKDITVFRIVLLIISTMFLVNRRIAGCLFDILISKQVSFFRKSLGNLILDSWQFLNYEFVISGVQQENVIWSKV